MCDYLYIYIYISVWGRLRGRGGGLAHKTIATCYPEAAKVYWELIIGPAGHLCAHLAVGCSVILVRVLPKLKFSGEDMIWRSILGQALFSLAPERRICQSL